MTIQQHKILYIIDITATCKNSQGIHLCPRGKDYCYFAYWSTCLFEKQNSKKIKFGSGVTNGKLQIKRETGEEIVSLKEAPVFCPNSTNGQRVEMRKSMSDSLDYAGEIKRLGLLAGKAIELVAIEKTFVLRENRGCEDMPIIDFIDVFDQVALLAHFKSLFYCYLDGIKRQVPGTEVLKRLVQLLKNWETIYNEKESIMNNVKLYAELIVQGIEEKGASSSDLAYLVNAAIKKQIIERYEADSILNFILPEESNKEQFQECVAVLNAYLKAYEEDEVVKKELLPYLEKYEMKDIQVDREIYKLRKIDLNSKESKIANAKLIEEYLRDRVKCSGYVLFEKIA